MMVLWWFVIVLSASACSASPNVVVALNTFRWLRLTSDKFLGLSVSLSLLSSTQNHSETTLAMLQGLAPTYLRLEGNDALDWNLETSTNVSGKNTLTEAQWESLNQLATDAGLRLIFSLNLSEFGHRRNQSRRSSLNNNTSLQQLLSLTDRQGYDPVWQYKYKIPSMMNATDKLSGKELGRNVMALRSALDKFPRYQKTAVLGPDFIINDNSKDLQFLKDFMLESNNVINTLVLQTKAQSHKNMEEDVFKALSKPVLAISKMLRMPSQSGRARQLTKKHLWIAESDVEGYSGQFVDAMTWAVKLGHAGRLGYHVVLRHPAQLTEPTPDYWVSFLYRNLVGSAVLSTRLMSGHSAVTVFANCAAYYERAARTALDAMAEYERGAVVVWGVNRGQESAQVTLLTTSQEYVHLYVLTASPDETKQGKPLLNEKQLSLNRGSLPKLIPHIQSTSQNMSVPVPAGSVFFIVLPRAGARACLLPAAFPKREELINPQWEQWQNIKSLTSTGYLLGDFIFAKGGIYENSEVVKKNEYLKSEMVNAKDNFKTGGGKDQARIMLRQQPSRENINETDLSKIKINDSILETVLPKLKDIENSLKNTEIENAVTNLENKSETTISALHKNGFLFSDDKRELETTRVKRSDNAVDSEEHTSTLSQVGISQLNRDFHHLHGNKPAVDNTNSELKSTSDRIFKPLYQTNKTAPKTPSQLRKETKMNRNHIQYESSLKLGETIDKSNDATSQLNKSTGKENENYHYHPGSFYETLVNLKTDSNISLADIEEQHDAFEMLFSAPTTCEDCKSLLKVTKRPANNVGTDRKIVENETEYLEQYFKNTEDLKKRNGLCENKLKSGEIEHVCMEDGEERQTKTLIDKENARGIASLDTLQNFSTENPFTTVKTTKNVSLKSLERIKRDTEAFKYISQIFNKNASVELSNNNSTNMSYPEEMQLRMFLQELTEEGEELLKSFDDEYEELNEQNNNLSEQNRLGFTVLKKNTQRNGIQQIPPAKEGSKSDFYTKTNLITNKTTKLKRKYNYTMPVSTLYNSKNISNAHKEPNVNLVKTTSDNSELVRDTEIVSTTTNPPNLDMLSTTDSIHDLNLYSKHTLPGEDLSEPNKNSSLYSSTPKPFVDFLKSFEYSKGNEKQNFDEINNPGTTVKQQNVLKPFQDERIKLPTTKTLYPLKLDTLDQSLIERSTDENLYLKLSLANEEVSKSNETPSPRSVLPRPLQQLYKDYDNFKVDHQDPNFKKPTDPESTMSKPVTQKFFQGETKILTTQTYRNLDDKRDTDVKESMVISTVSGTPTLKNSLFKTVPPKNEFDDREEKSNHTNSLALESQEGTNSNNLLVVNKSMNKRNYFQNTESKVSSLNEAPVLLNRLKEINSPLTTMLLNKQRERLGAIKERLEKAREYLENLRHHSTPTFPIIKLSNALSKNMVSDWKRNNNVNTEDILKKPKPPTLVAVDNKISVKKQLHSDDMPLPYDSDQISRRKRETPSLEGDEQESTTKVSPEKLETPSSVMMLINNESASDIVIESSYTPIHKWIIPLSDHTERIVMKNKIFPVKLFGVLSDDWKNQNDNKDVRLKDSERKSRSVQYSCMRDHFDDYSEEHKNVDGIIVEKDIKQVSHPSLLSNDNLEETNPNSPINPHNFHRKKRSVRTTANINNFDIRSRLTNEIKKEEPSNEAIVQNLSNDISEDEPTNNTFNSMLQKQIAEIMGNKTGLNRMLELAKLYQKTNTKSSLETFKSEESIIKNTSSKTGDSEEENKATEEPDSKEIVNEILQEGSGSNILEILFGKLNDTNVKEQSSSQQNTTSATTKTDTYNEGSKASKKNILSTLVRSIKAFFNNTHDVFTKLLNNVKPLQPTI